MTEVVWAWKLKALSLSVWNLERGMYSNHMSTQEEDFSGGAGGVELKEIREVLRAMNMKEHAGKSYF